MVEDSTVERGDEEHHSRTRTVKRVKFGVRVGRTQPHVHLDARPIRVSLDVDDFRTLVSGGIVLAGGVEITLDDIGHNVMTRVLLEAWSRQNRHDR